ncbi:hypothetical protein HETIRDRAFT_240525, partial [Heterobasidion irregulare TC 32-1]
MCVAFWSLDHPDYALILCANRDEFLDRPTAPAHFHSFEPVARTDSASTVLSGRDLLAGGTWMGLCRAGRLALLTNITEPSASYRSSRGRLVSSFLLAPGAHTLTDHVAELVQQEKDTAYAGFNLLLLEASRSQRRGPSRPQLEFDAVLVTNGGGGGALSARGLTPAERACGGLSNGIDGRGADAWPKVVRGTAALEGVLSEITSDTTPDELTERLFALLTWRADPPPHTRGELRNTIAVAPLPLRLAPPEPDRAYGTRLASVVLVRRDGSVLFVERDMWEL